MTDNPQAVMGGELPIVVESESPGSAWDRLRKQARQTKEAIQGMGTGDAFSFCIGNFHSFTEKAAASNSGIREAVEGFNTQVVDVLAKEIIGDHLLVASVPGKKIDRVVRTSNIRQASVERRMTIPLVEPLLWLNSEDTTEREGLRTSLFWVLVASFGTDPGPIENTAFVKDIGKKIMTGQSRRQEPPLPFSKSPFSSTELLIRTAILGVSISIDQNATISLCMEPQAIFGIVEKANESLSKTNFGDLMGMRLEMEKEKRVADYLSGKAK